MKKMIVLVVKQIDELRFGARDFSSLISSAKQRQTNPSAVAKCAPLRVAHEKL